MGRAELERLTAEETGASERTRDEPLSGRAAGKRPTRSVVYSVRLTPGQTEEIQRIAEAAGSQRPGWCAAGAPGAGGRAGGVGGADGGGAVAGRGPAVPPAHRAPGIVTGHLYRRCGHGRCVRDRQGRRASLSRSVTDGPSPSWNGSWTGSG